jgi:hypothetical protein
MPDQSYLDWPFFEERHHRLAQDVESFATTQLSDLDLHVEDDETLDATCREIVRRLARADLLKSTCVLTEEDKFDVRSLCLSREILGRHAGIADFAYAMQGLGSGPISLFGTREQRDAYLPGVIAGEKIAAFAPSEPDAGSDLAAMATTATKDGDDYVLNGTKTWISNGGLADQYVVFARTGEAPGLSSNGRIQSCGGIPNIRRSACDRIQRPAHAAQVFHHLTDADHVRISAMHVDQVLPMRHLVGIADTLGGYDDPEPVRKRVHRRRPNASAGHASGDNRRIYLVFGQKRDERRMEEHRRSVLAEREIVSRIVDARVQRQAFIAVEEMLVDRPDLPSRHVALAVVGGITLCNRHAARPREFQKLRGTVRRLVDHRQTAERVARIGKPQLQVDDQHGRRIPEFGLAMLVADILVDITHGSSLGGRSPRAVESRCFRG